jgi:hypothetical protein
MLKYWMFSFMALTGCIYLTPAQGIRTVNVLPTPSPVPTPVLKTLSNDLFTVIFPDFLKPGELQPKDPKDPTQLVFVAELPSKDIEGYVISTFPKDTTLSSDAFFKAAKLTLDQEFVEPKIIKEGADKLGGISGYGIEGTGKSKNGTPMHFILKTCIYNTIPYSFFIATSEARYTVIKPYFDLALAQFTFKGGPTPAPVVNNTATPSPVASSSPAAN